MAKYGKTGTWLDGIRNTKKTEIDGILFASKKEAERYQILKIFLNANKIKNLILQPRFQLIVNGKKVCRYTPDFQYLEVETGHTIIEEVKGYATRDYKLRKKLFLALYPEYQFKEI